MNIHLNEIEHVEIQLEEWINYGGKFFRQFKRLQRKIIEFYKLSENVDRCQ